MNTKISKMMGNPPIPKTLERDEPQPIPCKRCGTPMQYIKILRSWITPGKYCEKCLAEIENENIEKKRLKEYKFREDNIEILMKTAGIPDKYLGKSIYNFVTATPEHAAILDEIKNYIAMITNPDIQNKPGLFLYGNPGTGKTHLAVSIARCAILANNATVSFLNITNTVAKLKASFKDNGTFTERKLLYIAHNADILVLDDLGQEFTSDWVQSVIYMLVNEREYQGLPLILTSNLSLNTISNIYGQKLADRIAGTCIKIKFDIDSWRIRTRPKLQ